MADTRTISDDETTLDQLNEKTSLSNTDILLLRDQDNEDFKISAQNIKDSLIGGSVAAGNEKAVTGSAVNSALTNFDKIITETDANNCLGDETKEVRYFLNTNASNIPSSLPVSNILIDVNHIKLPSGNRNIFQTLYIWNANKIQKMYTRTILESGNSYTYSEWEKIVSETDLNNALTNLKTVSNVYFNVMYSNRIHTSMEALYNQIYNDNTNIPLGNSFFLNAVLVGGGQVTIIGNKKQTDGTLQMLVLSDGFINPEMIKRYAPSN